MQRHPRTTRKQEAMTSKQKSNLKKRKYTKSQQKNFEEKMRPKCELKPLYKVAQLFIGFEVAMLEWLLGLKPSNIFFLFSPNLTSNQILIYFF